jgi:hypothetical protein
MTDETPQPEENEDVEAQRGQDSAPAEDVEGHAIPFVDPPVRVAGSDALNER